MASFRAIMPPGGPNLGLSWLEILIGHVGNNIRVWQADKLDKNVAVKIEINLII